MAPIEEMGFDDFVLELAKGMNDARLRSEASCHMLSNRDAKADELNFRISILGKYSAKLPHLQERLSVGDAELTAIRVQAPHTSRGSKEKTRSNAVLRSELQLFHVIKQHGEGAAQDLVKLVCSGFSELKRELVQINCSSCVLCWQTCR